MLKRLTALCSTTCLLLLLCACGAQPMHIQEAEVPSEDHAWYATGDAWSLQPIYAFEFDNDGAVSNMEVRLYELIDGSWKQQAVLAKGEVPTQEVNHISMSFGTIPEGINVMGDIYTMDQPEAVNEQTSVSTTTLSSPIEFTVGEEIPLVLQALTESETVDYAHLEYFHTPEKLETLDYHYIYAVTLCLA